MLELSHDVARINKIVNDPAVRPAIGMVDLGDLDMAPLVEKPEHWFLMGEHGGFALTWSAPCVYEWHSFVLPEGRGKWAADARSEAIEYARHHGAKMLWSKIPPDAPHVDRFARQGGMKPTNNVVETFGVPYRVFSMELN
jgi:GNAT superfamily N-acetyltransferase